MSRFILTLISFLLVLNAQALGDTSRIQSAIELGSSISFTGVGLELLYVLQVKDHQVYLGPKLAASDSYLPAGGPWGMNVGYRYFLSEKGRFASFVHVDYQLVLSQPYEPPGFSGGGLNSTHEFYVGYGLRFRLNRHWHIVNQLGLGGYLERLIDVREGKTNGFSGYSSLLKLLVQYRF